jgi:hypothetical protein
MVELVMMCYWEIYLLSPMLFPILFTCISKATDAKVPSYSYHSLGVYDRIIYGTSILDGRNLLGIPWENYHLLAYTNLALIVFSLLLAYLFNVYGIKVLGAATAGTYIYTQPIMAAIIAMIFLENKLSFIKL